MTHYQIVRQEITTVLTRDVPKAVDELTDQVNALIAQGWHPQGGLATVHAGAGIYLMQAMAR